MKTNLLIVAYALGCCVLFPTNAASQIKVGTNPTTVNSAAAVEVESTSQGILFPRLTTTQMNAISSPPTGLVIFNTTEGCLYHYFSSAWYSAKDGVPSLEDADGDTKIQVEESADEDMIRFDVAGSQAAIIDENGNVGIGIDDPAVMLDMSADLAYVYATSPNAWLQAGYFANNDVGSYLSFLARGSNAVSTWDGNSLKDAATFTFNSTTKAPFILSTYSRSNILFGIEADEKMRLDTNGYLAIGLSAPTEILHIDANGDSLQMDNLAGTGNSLSIDNNGKVFRGPSFQSGFIQLTATTSTPTGWLVCDGSAVSRTTYADLFAAIDTAYGPGNGTTTFNLPDLQGRVPMGSGAGSGLTSRALGDSDGEETHTLTVSEMPSHSHNLEVNTGVAGAENPENNYLAETAEASYATSSTSGKYLGGTTSAGSGSAHNVIQPFTVVKYIIKY